MQIEVNFDAMKHKAIKIAFQILIGTAVLMTQFIGYAGNHPNMYINRAEIDAVKSKIKAQQEPWKTAYQAILLKADDHLSMVPLSVVDNGPGAVDSDPHKFSTDRPMTTSGQRNYPDNSIPNNNDGEAMRKMSTAIGSLGLAYAFTGDPRYASKAVVLLKHWMINPATYMAPINRNFSPHTPRFPTQWSINIMHNTQAILYGADLIWDYSEFDAATKAAVQNWARNIGKSAMKQEGGYFNNGENFRVALIADAGALSDDPTLLGYAFDRFKSIFDGRLDRNHNDGQMNLDGSLKHELPRSDSLHYHMFALTAMMAAAEIARHRGIDLYGFQLPDGRGLSKLMDYVAPGAANPAVWPNRNDPAYYGAGSTLFELAYLWKPNPLYMDVVAKWGKRFQYDRTTFGLPALTHARGAYPWRIW